MTKFLCLTVLLCLAAAAGTTPLPPSGGRDALGRADTVGGTTYDFQANGPGASAIAWDPGYGIHVAWTFSADLGAGFPDRNVRYNFYDASAEPPGWSFRTGPGFMGWGVNALTTRSGFGSLDVNSSTHCVYIGCHRGDTVRATVVRDGAPGSGVFWECAGPLQTLWPTIGLTSTQRVQVALTMDGGINNRTKLYHARIDPWCSWSTPAVLYGSAPYPGLPSYALAASKLSQRVAVAWGVTFETQEAAYLTVSANDGGSWSTPSQLTFPATFNPGSETLPSFDISSLCPFFDSRDSLHIAATVVPIVVSGSDSIGHVVPAEIWHWSVAGGWTRVARAACAAANMDGNIGLNATFAGHPTLCQGAVDELVCIWEAFDSTNVESSTGQLRADIWGARSTDGGVTWGTVTRVTDPDQASKRFPSVARQMKGDSVLICYLVDQVAGFAALGEGATTTNPVVVRCIAKTDFRVPVNGPDVGVARLLSPVGTVTLGAIVVPACSVLNYGNTTADYEVRMRIGGGYDTSATVAGHQPGTSRLVEFPSWTAGPVGDHAVEAFTRLAGDLVSDNDTAAGGCSVVPAGTPGWTEVSSMPLAPSGKTVKRGGWLAFDATSGLVYAAKGYKTTDFYSYDPVGDAWAVLSGMPYPLHPLWSSKPPRKGSKGCWDGDNYLYVTQGNNSLGFWRYDIGGDSWSILADVPEGPSGKKVKGGTDMVFRPGAPDYVYLLKGYRCEFFRYNIAANAWEQLDDAPTGVRNKWDKGSWVVIDPDLTTIWAHKAKYHELWAYSLATSSWSTTALAGMPMVGSSGRRKKSKDGGSAVWYGDRLHALKGGNTQEFWVYDVAGDVWLESDTVPQNGSTGKKKRVKQGGDIVSYGGGTFFALKGNKTTEMWRYVLGGVDATGPPRREGEAAGHGGATRYLRIAPSPARDAVTVRYELTATRDITLTLFDVSGRPVANFDRPNSGAGSHRLTVDAAALPRGVYLLRYDCGDRHATRKLVIE